MGVQPATTHISGLLPDVRSVLLSEWSDRYFKPVKALMSGMAIHEARGIAGQWIGHLKTNDERLCGFFQKNFTPASAEPRPDLFLYAFTNIDDEEFLKSFHDARTAKKLKSFVKETSAQLSSPAYRQILNDPQLLRFDELSEEVRTEVALRKPSAMYVPELRLFVMVNVDCYVVLRNQGFFGMLRRLVMSKTNDKNGGEMPEPSEVWLPLSSGVVTLPSAEDEKLGAAFLSHDPSLRASLAISLTNTLPDVKYLAADISYVNVRTKKMVAIERRSLIPGSAIADNPAILANVAENGMENFAPDGKAAEGEGPREAAGDPLALASQSGLSNGPVFGMFGPGDFWPKSKLAVSSRLTHVFVGIESFEDARILESIEHDEAVAILSSKDNVTVYDRSRGRDATPEATSRITSPWFDGHWIVPDSGGDDPYAERRDAIMRELLGEDIQYFIVNARIPASQIAFCIINRIAGEFDSVSIKPEEEVDRILCAKLRLFRKKSSGGGSALFSYDGRRSNVLCFHKRSGMTYYAALDADETGPHFVKSYSRGTVNDFYAHHSHPTTERPVRSAV